MSNNKTVNWCELQSDISDSSDIITPSIQHNLVEIKYVFFFFFLY